MGLQRLPTIPGISEEHKDLHVYNWLRDDSSERVTYEYILSRVCKDIPAEVEFNTDISEEEDKEADEQDGMYRLDLSMPVRGPLRKGADIVVQDAGYLPLFFDYPLSVEFIVYVEVDQGGITRLELAKVMSAIYKEIYAIETATTSKKIETIAEWTRRTGNSKCLLLQNRVETDGQFGIYGHFLSDLYMIALQLDTKLGALCMTY